MSPPDPAAEGRPSSRPVRRAPTVVGFAGHSGVGKTSLLVSLIDALGRRGHGVGALKHASHGFHADRPGKDSHRLYESGAQAVAIISREQIATFTRADSETSTEVSLAAVLATLPEGLDLVLAEGFSWEPIPRVVLFPEDKEPSPDHLRHGEVIALVPVPPAAPGCPPIYPPARIEELIRIIEERMANERERRAGEVRR